MAAARNEHLVVIMLEPLPLDEEFEVWPMHITLVPWFPCDDGGRLDKVLNSIAARHAGFGLKTEKVEQWGRGKDKFNVMTIAANHKLHSLHWDIFSKLEKAGYPIHQKDYLGDKYRPHITLRNQKSDPEALKSAAEIPVTGFTLVKQDRLKGSGRMIKSAVKNYELG